MSQPEIDWEQFDTIVGDGSDGMTELFHEFTEEVFTKLTRLKEFAAAGDAKSLAWDSHQLKGSAGNFGLVSFVAEAARLEQSSKAGEVAEAGDTVERLRHLFSVSLEIIRSEREFLR